MKTHLPLLLIGLALGIVIGINRAPKCTKCEKHPDWCGPAAMSRCVAHWAANGKCACFYADDGVVGLRCTDDPERFSTGESDG